MNRPTPDLPTVEELTRKSATTAEERARAFGRSLAHLVFMSASTYRPDRACVSVELPEDRAERTALFETASSSLAGVIQEEAHAMLAGLMIGIRLTSAANGKGTDLDDYPPVN